MAKKSAKKKAVRRTKKAEPQPTENTGRRRMLANAVRSISRYYNDSDDIDPRRSINDECGYPATDSITLQNYRDMYLREGVASRVVEIFPSESWLLTPTVTEDANPQTSTEFERDWEGLNREIAGSSWYQGETGGIVWDYLQRVDVLSGIGSYGVILIGIDDGLPLHEPVKGFERDMPTSPVGEYNVLFFRAFSEDLAQITAYETDPSNSRYGQPTQYALTVGTGDGTLDSSGGSASPTQSTVNVHWSRIIHIADNLRSSELFGLPRQLQVFNYLLNIRKLLGASPEMYYKGAFPGISFETHPELGGDVDIDNDDMRTMIENYANGLQRYIMLLGMSANSLRTQVEDPSDHLQVQIDAICIRLGVPKRIFMGSERGELASGQDERAWNRRLSKRQNDYLSPRVISPTIDRLILFGVLSEPGDGYTILWPSMDNLTDEQRAVIAAKRTESMVKYLQGGGENLLHPKDFLTGVLEIEDDVAEGYLENVMPAEDEGEFDVDTEGDT